jgi:putative ATP-dependent endonuclease of the OLD family
MVIKSIHVKNFRSILDESLSCDCLTALVGRNGAGKSSFLRALELFYDPAAKVAAEDFYAEDIGPDIEIAVSFSELTPEETDFFGAYIDGGTLTVARIFSLASGKKSGTYHGMRLQNPAFLSVRNAGGKREILSQYKELRAQPEYASLLSVTKGDDALDAMTQWENANPGRCVRERDEGQFFGFTGVGQGYLGRFTRFIRIPAVRDASDDATEGKGSCVTEIMNLVVRSALTRRPEVTAFREETQTKYRDIMDFSKLTELTSLQDQLSQTLKYYAPDASVSLNWAELADINVPMPEAEIKLLEDGYSSCVHQTGHGLQRAFILTMLQHLVAARETDRALPEAADEAGNAPAQTPLPSLILAIEEPELYQHPCRQRHLASVLLQLATGAIPGVVEKTQVIYSTHAPLFVGLDRFDQIRLLRKTCDDPNTPKITKVARADLSKVANVLWNLDGQRGDKYTAATLRPRLQAVMTPWMNEGFFADLVVLVEGDGDRAALSAAADMLGHNFPSMGVCVIPCIGKNNLDRPAVVFRDLGIKTYLVWDNDKEAKEPKPHDNRRLLRLMGAAEEDWPSGVWDSHACFDPKLETVLVREITSEIFGYHFSKAMDEFRIEKDRAMKNPFVLRSVVEGAYSEKHYSKTLTSMVEKICSVRNSG